MFSSMSRFIQGSQPDWKTRAIRRAAVREAGVSWHHGDTIEGLSETPSDHHITIVLRGLRGVLNQAPIFSR